MSGEDQPTTWAKAGNVIKSKRQAGLTVILLNEVHPEIYLDSTGGAYIIGEPLNGETKFYKIGTVKETKSAKSMMLRIMDTTFIWNRDRYQQLMDNTLHYVRVAMPVQTPAIPVNKNVETLLQNIQQQSGKPTSTI